MLIIAPFYDRLEDAQTTCNYSIVILDTDSMGINDVCFSFVFSFLSFQFNFGKYLLSY